MRRRRLAIIPAGAALALLLTAGACEDRGTVDAPIDQRLQDNQAPLIVNMPDGFMNLALKCVGSTLVAAHTRQGPPVLVAESDACAEGRAESLGIPRAQEGGR